MTLFVLVAGLLLVAALLFVLPVLLRSPDGSQEAGESNEVNLIVLRDQLRELDLDLNNGIIDPAGYAAARAELEKRVASDVLSESGSVGPTAVAQPKGLLSIVLISLSVPVIAISLYVVLGTPNALDPEHAGAATDASAAVTPQQIDSMVASLEQKLKANPDDVQGWDMLARSYHTQGRYREAAEAYAKLVKLVPDNADILADYADALGMAQNKSLLGEPEKIIAEALKVDPRNVKALALSGSAAFDQRNFALAVEQWKKILTLVDPQSETARSIIGSINEAQSLAGGPVVNAGDQAAPAPAAVAVAGKAVEGEVRLDASLLKKVNPEATVFIFARAEQGPRFPLAVLKKQVKELPVQFHLDDSMGMMPNVKLSDYPKIVVGARISELGSATPQAGDWEGLSSPVAPGATGLSIVINTQHH